MKMEFTLGQDEKHTINFSWEQMIGTSCISVDGKVVLRGRPLAIDEVKLLLNKYKYLYDIYINRRVPWQRIRSWDFEVGDQERYFVRIEKERPLLLAAFRPHSYRVYIDGDLIIERRGY